MALSRLQIHHVRNLRHIELEILQQVNVFFGPTERKDQYPGVHSPAGYGAIFRSGGSGPDHPRRARMHGIRVRRDVTSGPEIPLGFSAAGGGCSDQSGAPRKAVAELARHLPLQLINADSFELLTGPPRARRQFLDWGVFHVEHRFLGEWQRFQRCIKQRNKLLRRGRMPRGIGRMDQGARLQAPQSMTIGRPISSSCHGSGTSLAACCLH